MKLKDLDEAEYLAAIESRRALTRKLEALGYDLWDMEPSGTTRYMNAAGSVKLVSYDELTRRYIDTNQITT